MVTFKNMWLVFKDQLPFKRFFRNFFITRNAWGLFSINSCINSSTGNPKIKYSQASAKKAALKMSTKYEVHFSVYKCLFCDDYHIGKNKDNKLKKEMNFIVAKNFHFNEKEIKKIEKKYKVTYIGDFDKHIKRGDYSIYPASLFYQPNPDVQKGHSNYLAIERSVREPSKIILFNGEQCIKDPLPAISDGKGNIYVSCFNYDFKSIPGTHFFIDGGRHCTRISGDKLINVRFNKDKLEIVE